MIDLRNASLGRVEAALSKMAVEDAARLASVLEFEGSLAEKLQRTSVGPYVVDSDGMIRVPAVLFAGDTNKVCTLLLHLFYFFFSDIGPYKCIRPCYAYIE